ncbi:MAG: hypothetical protein D6832_00885 [Alphaproteobacteria bacterium]|nr:MAG: hypothetical protein D6832_00885 [Alphaproteobacteria bacterium]
MRALMVAALALAAAGAEAGPAYLDDRSTPEAVIHSLYNAVTLHDYPRAWSYFDEGSRPDYELFAAGYSDTERVRVKTGVPREEGAAGTTWWAVPTVIEAERRDGSRAVFAGCYVLNKADPHLIDEPPYDPIAIVRGRLRPVAVPFARARGDCSGM